MERINWDWGCQLVWKVENEVTENLSLSLNRFSLSPIQATFSDKIEIMNYICTKRSLKHFQIFLFQQTEIWLQKSSLIQEICVNKSIQTINFRTKRSLKQYCAKYSNYVIWEIKDKNIGWINANIIDINLTSENRRNYQWNLIITPKNEYS